MIKFFNQSFVRLSLTKTKSLLHASLIVGALVALLSVNGEAQGQGAAVPPSNPFVVLLEGPVQPAGVVSDDLGLELPNLANGKYMTVPIYNLANGVPGLTDEVVGSLYALGGEGFFVYDLGKGALTAIVTAITVIDVSSDGEGGFYRTATYELDILEATGIYQSFAGGHIHMAAVTHRTAAGGMIEHCFCHISREHGKP